MLHVLRNMRYAVLVVQPWASLKIAGYICATKGRVEANPFQRRGVQARPAWKKGRPIVVRGWASLEVSSVATMIPPREIEHSVALGTSAPS